MSKKIRQIFVIDKSGSMLSQKKSVIDGINESLQTMKMEEEKTGVEYLVTIVQFAHEAEMTVSDQKLSEVPPFNENTYQPCGGTALYDGIALAIQTCEVGQTDTIVTVYSDGAENSSKKWKSETIKALIDLRTKEQNWAFVFFGCDMNSLTQAKNIGIANSVAYSTNNNSRLYAASTMMRGAYVNCSLTNNYSGVDKNLASMSNVNLKDLVDPNGSPDGGK